MMALLALGSFEFVDFEVSGEVSFGGAQKLAIHKLIGGTRVIDVMGRDDSDVTWSGIFSGGDAGDRARVLDAMRAAGAPLSLTWDEFCYTVVIEKLEMNFCNPWWIPYRIACAVVVDQAQSLSTYVPDLAGAILGDLTSASAYYDVSTALEATAVPDALTEGEADYTTASVVLASTAQSIDAGIQTAQSSLSSTSLATLVSASGSLAQLCAARGYVERSINNLDGAGT
jgi:hypothetical protein